MARRNYYFSQVAAITTERLRQSDDPTYRRLRELLPTYGIDVHADVLADLFEDDPDGDFGIIVTTERRAFTFDFKRGEDPQSVTGVMAGFIINWKEIVNLDASIYVDHVRAAFRHLPK